MNETEKTTFSVPSPGELEQLTELHKAMGDYTRMRILWYLMQKDSCVSELAQKMEVTESAISHQLRALRIVRLSAITQGREKRDLFLAGRTYPVDS